MGEIYDSSSVLQQIYDRISSSSSDNHDEQESFDKSELLFEMKRDLGSSLSFFTRYFSEAFMRSQNIEPLRAGKVGVPLPIQMMPENTDGKLAESYCL